MKKQKIGITRPVQEPEEWTVPVVTAYALKVNVFLLTIIIKSICIKIFTNSGRYSSF